jgi:hypothetical protein
MITRIIVQPRAKRHIREGQVWYRGTSPELGDDFLESVDTAILAQEHRERKNEALAPTTSEVALEQNSRSKTRILSAFCKVSRIVTAHVGRACGERCAQQSGRGAGTLAT